MILGKIKKKKKKKKKTSIATEGKKKKKNPSETQKNQPLQPQPNHNKAINTNTNHQQSHRSTNPRHRFETQAVENTQKSSPELPMINPNDLPTDQQIHHFKPTDQLIQTHHQRIPAQRSKPSSPIHANPTSNLKNPKPSTGAMRERPCDER